MTNPPAIEEMERGVQDDGHDKRTIEAVAESKSFEFSMGRAMAV